MNHGESKAEYSLEELEQCVALEFSKLRNRVSPEKELEPKPKKSMNASLKALLHNVEEEYFEDSHSSTMSEDNSTGEEEEYVLQRDDRKSSRKRRSSSPEKELAEQKDTVDVVESESFEFAKLNLRYGYSKLTSRVYFNSIDLLRAIYGKKPTRGAPSRFGPVILRCLEDPVMHFSRTSGVLYLSAIQAIHILQTFKENSKSTIIDPRKVTKLLSIVSNIINSTPNMDFKNVRTPSPHSFKYSSDEEKTSSEHSDEESHNSATDHDVVPSPVREIAPLPVQIHIAPEVTSILLGNFNVFTIFQDQIQYAVSDKQYYFNARDFLRVLYSKIANDEMISTLSIQLRGCEGETTLYMCTIDHQPQIFLSFTQVSFVLDKVIRSKDASAAKALTMFEAFVEFTKPKEAPQPVEQPEPIPASPVEEAPESDDAKKQKSPKIKSKDGMLISEETLVLLDVSFFVVGDTKVQYGYHNGQIYFNSVDLLKALHGKRPNRGAPSLLSPILVDFQDPVLRYAKSPMKLVFLTYPQAVYVTDKYSEKFRLESHYKDIIALKEVLANMKHGRPAPMPTAVPVSHPLNTFHEQPERKRKVEASFPIDLTSEPMKHHKQEEQVQHPYMPMGFVLLPRPSPTQMDRRLPFPGPAPSFAESFSPLHPNFGRAAPMGVPPPMLPLPMLGATTPQPQKRANPLSISQLVN